MPSLSDRRHPRRSELISSRALGHTEVEDQLHGMRTEISGELRKLQVQIDNIKEHLADVAPVSLTPTTDARANTQAIPSHCLSGGVPFLEDDFASMPSPERRKNENELASTIAQQLVTDPRVEIIGAQFANSTRRGNDVPSLKLGEDESASVTSDHRLESVGSHFATSTVSGDSDEDDLDSLMVDLYTFLSTVEDSFAEAKQLRQRFNKLYARSRHGVSVVSSRMTVCGRLFGKCGEAFATRYLNAILQNRCFLWPVRVIDFTVIFLTICSTCGAFSKRFSILAVWLIFRFLTLYSLTYWDLVRQAVLSFDFILHMSHVATIVTSGMLLARLDERISTLWWFAVYSLLPLFVDALPPPLAFLSGSRVTYWFAFVMQRFLLPMPTMFVLISAVLRVGWWASDTDDKEFSYGALRITASSLFISSCTHVLATQVNMSLHIPKTACFLKVPLEVKYEVSMPSSSSLGEVLSARQASTKSSFLRTWRLSGTGPR